MSLAADPLACRVEALRVEVGVSVADLAVALGVSRSGLWRILNGRRTNPDVLHDALSELTHRLGDNLDDHARRPA